MGQVREAVPGSASRRCGLSASLVPRALGNIFLTNLVIIGGAGGLVRGHLSLLHASGLQGMDGLWPGFKDRGDDRREQRTAGREHL